MTVDRRSFPRYPLAFPVNLKFAGNDEDFLVKSVNVSRTNVEICCDRVLIDYLIAQENYPHTCNVTFKIPNQEHVFKIDSQVITHRRLSQNIYHLVLIFPDYVNEAGDFLGECLSVLQPGEMNPNWSMSRTL